MGIRPRVIAGTSVGALVGAMYAAEQLDAFADWVLSLGPREVFGLMDLTFTGGVVKGEKLFSLVREKYANPDIETLAMKFVSVATEMHSGREVWLTHGPVLSAARASCALPGLFSPVRYDDTWMLDGGLVNPVPVSACRAYGADVVIAVNLNSQRLGRHIALDAHTTEKAVSAEELSIWQRLMDYFSASPGEPPSFFDVVASSVNIMQDRITRSRMAGDPPEVTLVPQLEDLAVMDFHRAAYAIAEGRRVVARHADAIHSWVENRG